MSTSVTSTAEGGQARFAPKTAHNEPVPGVRGRAATAWAALERLLVTAGDWLNPILIKETRQAIKSFQFTITFVLLLVGCWVITMGGVAIVGPRIYYAAEGGSLLLWYYNILAFPLTVVVPYAAFRSLAAEREDNTYDLLSITTLQPWQIISGKLGSSVVQMGIYFSAITPCLAFTYLLRGIDLPTIAVLLAYLFFWSLGLSMLGILLATLTKRRFAHVFTSVAFVGGLLIVFWYPIVGTTSGMIETSYSYLGSSEFWIGTLAIATFYATFFALAFFAAAGMITFASENRSTPLRICMLVQTAAFVGWMGYALISSNYERAVVLVFATIASIYWYIMGTLLTAEKPFMSQRVKRRLPQSFFGRAFFSWLNPGPASGYMFVAATTISLALMCFIGTYVSDRTGIRRAGPPTAETIRFLVIIGWSYLIAYLGIGLLVIRGLRRVAVVTMLASVLIHFLLVLGGFGIPYAIKSMSLKRRELDYSLLQITDPFLSLYHVANGATMADVDKLLVVVPGVALCILLANMPSVIQELRVVREAAPKRVLEDEAALHPAAGTVAGESVGRVSGRGRRSDRCFYAHLRPLTSTLAWPSSDCGRVGGRL